MENRVVALIQLQSLEDLAWGFVPPEKPLQYQRPSTWRSEFSLHSKSIKNR